MTISSPALAAPTADSPIGTVGGRNFVSTSADGNITAAYSGTTGLTVFNSTTQQTSSYTSTELVMASVGEAVVSPDGAEIYLLGDVPSSVGVFDVASGLVTRRIPLPWPSWMGAITPDGSTLLVYGKASQELVSIDLGTDTVSAPLDLASQYPYQLCVTSDSSTLYLPAYDTDEIDVVDISTLSIVSQLTDTDGPLACALGADDTLYIGDYDTGAVRKYSADGSFIVSATGMAEQMYGMGLTCNSVIVGDYQNTGYVTLDRASLARTGTLPSDVYTYMMAVTADAKTTWVGGYAAEFGLQSVSEETCPVSLPDTGASPSIIGTSLSVSAGLLAAGVIALLVVRRRNRSN